MYIMSPCHSSLSGSHIFTFQRDQSAAQLRSGLLTATRLKASESNHNVLTPEHPAEVSI